MKKIDDLKWTIWYDYKGEVDFNFGLEIELEYKGGLESYKGLMFPKFTYIYGQQVKIDENLAKRYRIKLEDKGIKVIKYDILPPSNYLGIDTHNKIVVVEAA